MDSIFSRFSITFLQRQICIMQQRILGKEGCFVENINSYLTVKTMKTEIPSAALSGFSRGYISLVLLLLLLFTAIELSLGSSSPYTSSK
jgi:hypothetical protein